MSSLVIRITGDPTSFQNAMDGVGRSLDGAARKAEAVSAKLSSLGNSLSIGITLPAIAAGTALVKTAADMEALRMGLTAVAGSSAETEKQLVRLKEVAKLPGLGFAEAIQGSVRLQSAGFSAQLAERSLKAFGNALATVGKGKAELDGVTLALSQIASKGKISAEEINQLAERVPQIRVAMKAAFGTADTEVLQKAGIGAEEFVTRVVAQLEKLKQVTGGTKNGFENLSDAIQAAADRIGQKLLPTINELLPKFEALVTGAADAVDGFTKLPPQLQNTALAFGAVAIAAGPIAGIIGRISTAFAGLQVAAGAAGAGIAGLFGLAVIASIAQTMTAMDQLKAKYEEVADFRARMQNGGKADLIAGFEDNGKPLGNGASMSSGGIFEQPATAAKKFGIDLRALSDELGLFGSSAKKAEGDTLNLADAHEKVAKSVTLAYHAHKAAKPPTMDLLALFERFKDVAAQKTKAVDVLAQMMDRYGTVTEVATIRAAKGMDLLFQSYRQLSDVPDLENIAKLLQIDFSKLPKAKDVINLGVDAKLSAPMPGDFEAFKNSGRNIGPEGMLTKEQAEAIKARYKDISKTGRAALQQVSTIITDLSRGIADVIFQGGKFGDMMAKVAKQAGQAIVRELIEGALKKLTAKLLDVGGIFGKVFGGAGGAGGTIFSAAGSAGGAVASSAGGAVSSAGSAAGAATSSVAGIVGAVGSVVSAVSGVIGNFQMMGMNKTLDLIEKEVRYSQIHLLNTLNKANEYWPYMKTCWESLIRMEQRQMAVGGGGVTNNFAGAYFLTDSAFEDFMQKQARWLKAQGF